MYKSLVRPILFRLKPENAHRKVVKLGQCLSYPLIGNVVGYLYRFDDDVLHSTHFDIHFNNPVGMAAGFDKNGALLGFFPNLGFGYVEMGSVTAEYGEGNPEPRVFRLPEDEAIINRMGLNNDGADAVYERLYGRGIAIPVGVNIAKTHDPEIMGERAIEDFCYSFRVLYPVGDYVTINISCPNTEEGKTFEDKAALVELLSAIKETEGAFQRKKPVFVKISPDVTYPMLDDILEVSEDHGISGYVIGNTSLKRHGLNTDAAEIERIGKGGLSGKPIKKITTELIDYTYSHLGDPFIIGVGGIFSGEDAYEKILAGASLFQVYDGLIYEGPGLPKRINRDLAGLLKRDGFTSISEAVGIGHKN
jgi:dihydroorotate dehydrogenase